jgi:hypothetical protein
VQVLELWRNPQDLMEPSALHWIAMTNWLYSNFHLTPVIRRSSTRLGREHFVLLASPL